MKVAPVASPHQVGASIKMTTTNDTAARQRAVSMLNTGAPSPVQNQSQVQPEEMSAITNTSQGQTEQLVDTAPEATEEQLAETPPQPTEQELKLKRQFEHLAKQEKILRQKANRVDQDLKAREAALQAREAALTGKDQDYSQNYFSKDQLRRDPISVLAEAGLSSEEITNRILNPQPLDPRIETMLAKQEAKIKELEAKNERFEKQTTESQSEQYKAALNQIEQDVRSMVKSDSAFETIRIERAEKAVVDLIERTFKEEKRLMTNEEAAAEVEAYLEERAAKKISQLSQVDRIKKRLEQSATASKAAVQTPAKSSQQTQPMKTLTNSASSTRQLSARERALLAFKGELKS